MKRKPLFLIAAAVLLLSVVLQFRRAVVVEAHPRQDLLKDLLPASRPGWAMSDQPIADTPEMKRAVTEMLNFDEAVFRTYRHGNEQISIYVAYWRPGSMHPRLITQHIPDVCWPGAGWNMLQSGGTAAFDLPGNQRTWAGQWRIFSARGTTEHVVYWHLLGGKLSGYAQGANSKSAMYYLTLWDDIRQAQREQYFIRLSSNLSLAELEKSELVRTVMAALASLGLQQAAT